MSYVAISDFKFGMDRRRPIVAGVPGTLWILKNAALTRGGDIERLKKFVEVSALPAGATAGLHAIGDQRYVFGAGAKLAGFPRNTQYQRLQPPFAANITRVLDTRSFDGKIYAIGEFDDGNVYHFFNGTRVSDWDALADAACSYETVAARLALKLDTLGAINARNFGNTIEIEAVVAGVPFTVAGATVDGGAVSSPSVAVTIEQANVTAISEVRAVGTLTVTGGSSSVGVNEFRSIVIDAKEFLGSPVPWVSSNADTASSLAANINANAYGYRATVAGAVVSVFAPIGEGAGANGRVITLGSAGDVTWVKTNFASGVNKRDAQTQIVKVTISGAAIDGADLWQITVNGTVTKTTGRASAMGTSAYVRKRRVFCTAGSLVRYSKLGDPANWSDPAISSGAGFLNIANEAEGADALVGMADYNELTAIFAKDTIVTYSFTADAAETQIAQTIGNTGTFAPKSVVAYGANDVFYVDKTGVRSLRARETYNAAYASDVGSAVDTFLQEIFAEENEEALAQASAAIETRDGRYFLALGRKILVLSQFPASQIVGWSFIDFGQPIEMLLRSGKTLYLRSNDKIYAYGGAFGEEYPGDNEFPIEALIPFVSAKDPAGHKTIQELDIAATNVWKMEVLVDPNDLSKRVNAGVVYGSTYTRPSHTVPGRTTMSALRFTCDRAGPATLSSIALHFEKAIN